MDILETSVLNLFPHEFYLDVLRPHLLESAIEPASVLAIP